MLDKSRRFRKTFGGYDKNKRIGSTFPKAATPEQLLEIEQKLKKENRILWIKTIVVFLMVIGSLFWLLSPF